MPDISVQDLAAARATGGIVLDVRTDAELAVCRLDPCIHIPLHQLPQRWEELSEVTGPIYCLCHHGMRSSQAAAFLRHHDLEAVNVSGGIDAYARIVDPSLSRY